MGCKHCDFDGNCELLIYDEEGKISEDNVDLSEYGVDEETGACVVEDDPDPSYSCSGYESDGSDDEDLEDEEDE